MTEPRWTESMVEEPFVEAADVMRRLPDVCVQGHFNTWPRTLFEFSDLVSHMRGQWPGPSPPTPQDLSYRLTQLLSE
jgi:hypothetical protein